MRCLGLDLGSRRIGVAVSDPSGVVATPLTTILRGARSEGAGGDRIDREVAALVDEYAADCVVVGLPRALSGRVTDSTRLVLDEVARLRESLSVPVHTWDERLTTVQAQESLRRLGVDSRKGRDKIDEVAATIMLQSWLDAGRPGTEPR
jgi:putative Holliday junction resolvase